MILNINDINAQPSTDASRRVSNLLQMAIRNKDENIEDACDDQLKQHRTINRSEIEDPLNFTGDYFTFVKLPLEKYSSLQHDNLRLVRCSRIWHNTYETLIDLIAKDVRKYPQLIVSCYGGARYFTMSDDLEKTFINDIGQIATTENVWLLTTGLDSGVSKLIGQAVHRKILLDDNSSKPVVIGMTGWNILTNDARQYIKKQISPGITSMEHHFTRSSLSPLDRNHTHCLLLNNNDSSPFINDEPRSRFVQVMCEKRKCHGVTVIVEGGRNTLEVILHDVEAKRPVVIVHGSGRMASLLGMLLKTTDNKMKITREQIEQYLQVFPQLLSQYQSDNHPTMIDKIEEVLELKYRPYLKIFDLHGNISLTTTIFQAVFDIERDQNMYFKASKAEELLQLAISWDYLDGAHEIFKRSKLFETSKDDCCQQFENSKAILSNLFKEVLVNQRTAFVDYFFRRYYNPLRAGEYIIIDNNKLEQDVFRRNFTTENAQIAFRFIKQLYNDNEDKFPRKLRKVPESLEDLDRRYKEYIGPYVKSFYYEESISQRINEDLIPQFISISTKSNVNTQNIPQYSNPYDEQEMLRDIFLWSVYAGYADIAFVLLLQIKSRIGAALLAAAIAKRISLSTNNLDTRRKYTEQVVDYTNYATECITRCQQYDERRACQILLLKRVIYGDITYMQIAIASHIISFVNTDCFDKVLIEQWKGHLDKTWNGSIKNKCAFICSIFLFGLTAPFMCTYSTETKVEKRQKKNEKDNVSQSSNDFKNQKDPKDEENENVNYWSKLKKFHSSSAVKMIYHFLIYIFFLLAFSYMMMFHMKSENEQIHWTKIYVIITISAMLIEDIRCFIIEYHHQMLERWHSTKIWKVIINIIPYLLFYIGIGLHFGAVNNPSLFWVARILLAIDLEWYYLFSLHFLSVFEFFGPKLVMIRKMVYDLTAFLYVIFVCATAYGVVSSSLTMYSSLQFTAQNITSVIFYRTYWFLHGSVDEEKSNLDEIISSDSSTTGQVAEATINHILLAFHMILINILILNLLIAVFGHSIEDVKTDSKFVWNYQRYKLVREYYEKPMFVYPPLSLFAYIGLLIKKIVGWSPIFKILKSHPNNSDKLIDFEHEATYLYAREVVENKYRKNLQNEKPPENLSELKTTLITSTKLNLVAPDQLTSMFSNTSNTNTFIHRSSVSALIDCVPLVNNESTIL